VELVLQVESHHHKVALICSGKLVAGDEAEALQAALSRLLEASEGVTLNLGSVYKIDCAGLGVIADAARRARLAGRSFELCAVPDAVWRMLRLTGLHQALTIQGVQPSAASFAA